MLLPGNYTYFAQHNTSGVPVGNTSYCAETYQVTQSGNFTTAVFNKHSMGPSDIWWLCGGVVIWSRLPPYWSGTCVLVQLVMPLYILPLSNPNSNSTHNATGHASRQKRSTSPAAGSFDPQIHIDAIGVPRREPDEFKARDQIAAGFQSRLFWWSTINKNVDCNIYYNQQRFFNYTRDAVKGLAELDATSKMAC